MELSLRNYIAGHVLRKGMWLFEDAMGPWVKEQAKLHYGNKRQLDPDEDDRLAADYAVALSVHEKERDALITRRDELDELLKTGPKEGKRDASRQKKDVAKRLIALTASSPRPPPTPRWVEECREFFGQPNRSSAPGIQRPPAVSWSCCRRQRETGTNRFQCIGEG